MCGEGGGGVVLMKEGQSGLRQSGENVFKNSPIRRYLQRYLKTSAHGFRKRDLGMKILG